MLLKILFTNKIKERSWKDRNKENDKIKTGIRCSLCFEFVSSLRYWLENFLLYDDFKISVNWCEKLNFKIVM